MNSNSNILLPEIFLSKKSSTEGFEMTQCKQYLPGKNIFAIKLKMCYFRSSSLRLLIGLESYQLHRWVLFRRKFGRAFSNFSFNKSKCLSWLNKGHESWHCWGLPAKWLATNFIYNHMAIASVDNSRSKTKRQTLLQTLVRHNLLSISQTSDSTFRHELTQFQMITSTLIHIKFGIF